MVRRHVCAVSGRCFASLRSSSVDRAAQQLDVELAAGEQHVVKRLADVAALHCCAAIAGDARLRDAPHQFLDEGGADALGPLRGLEYDRLAERRAPAIEVDKLPAGAPCWDRP